MSAQKEIVKKIDLGFVQIYLVRPQIVCIECIEEEQISVENGIQIIESIKNLVGDMPHATLVNAGNLYVPAKDFYKFIVSQRSAKKDNLLARALVTTNIAQRLDGQNFINTYNPQTPTKLFSSVEEAIDWIEPLLIA